MTITKFEQSGFIIETASGFRLALDIGVLTPIEKLEHVAEVDCMVISHIHKDHFSPAHIAKLNPKTLILPAECNEVLHPKSVGLPVGASLVYGAIHPEVSAHSVLSNKGLIYEADDIKISFFHVDHGPNVSAPVDNYGFLIEAGGQKIYFAGDMFYPSGMDVSSLETDYALIPVGEYYTFGPEEAYAFAKQFKAIKNLVPMHDRGNVETTNQFSMLAGKEFNVVVM